MKKIALLIFLIATNASVYSQNITEWAGLYGASNAAATSIATTSNGDMYAFGRFYETATFGTSTITSVGSNDIFLAKITASGTLVWLKQMGTSSLEKAYSVGTYNNEVYIYGGFVNTLSLGANTLTSNGSEDVFVAKLDTSGNFIWAKSGGSLGKEFIYSKGMTLDKKGNVYITGETSSNQPMTFGSVTIPGSTYGGLFIVKYNTSGNVEWATSGILDSGTNAAPLDIKADENDNVYITGGYGGKLTFGSTTIAGYSDAFLVKYNPGGNVVWAKTIGGSDRVTGTSVCCDKNNNVFVSGESNGNLTFGSITSNGGTGGFNTELYLTKYDSMGNALWAKRAGTHNSSPLSISSRDVICDNAGNVYWTGNYYDTLDFYSGGVKTNALKGSSLNVFVAKYDANGNAQWALDGGGKADDEAMGLHLYSQSLYVTGGFYTGDSTKFGSQGFKANSANNENLFIAKIANATSIDKIANFKDMDVVVYPNPANDKIIIEGVNVGATINIVDIIGRDVKTVIAKGNKEEISVKELPPSNYVVITRFEDKSSFHKITKL